MSVVCGKLNSMTDTAFMTYSAWATSGDGIVANSEKIRNWIGPTGAYVFCAEKKAHFTSDGRVEKELRRALLPVGTKAFEITYPALSTIDKTQLDAALIVLIPHGEKEVDWLRRALDTEVFTKVFVVLWRDKELAIHHLRGVGATDLESDSSMTPDPIYIEAARLMVNEEYNGLESGNGKDTVIGLIRVLRDSGYPVDKDSWLAAYFAAGGQARHAEAVEKFIDEMQRGTKHRVRERFRPGILDLLQERVEKRMSAVISEKGRNAATRRRQTRCHICPVDSSKVQPTGERISRDGVLVGQSRKELRNCNSARHPLVLSNFGRRGTGRSQNTHRAAAR